MVVVISLMHSLFGCKEGDPTALKQAVKAADLNVASISVQPLDGVITTGPEFPVQFTAIGHRPDGSTVDVTKIVEWTSSDTAIATINTDGQASTVTDGVVTISAGLASLSGSTSLTASSEPLLSIAIYADTGTPNILSVSACKNLQLKAIGTYADGVRDIIPITDYVTWAIVSGNGSFSDDDYGLLSTNSDGVISVQASLGIDSPVTDVNVTADLNTISITPLSKTIRINEPFQYTATGTYSDNSVVNITGNVLWSSDNTTVANFINPETEKGLITGLALGSTSVTAACGISVSSAASLTVSDQVLDYLRFEGPNGNEILAFSTVVDAISQITLRAYYTNGENRDVTDDADWSLLEGTPAGIITVNNTNNKGRITALAVGQANVRVVYQQREKVLQVTVN